MELRRAVKSPPAVAGLIVLALVIAAILGVRAGMNDGSTEVAGTVFERSEVPTAEPTVPADETVEPLIVRPRRDSDDADDGAEAPVEVAEAPAPTAPAPTVGLIRDPDPVVVVQPPADDPDPDRPGDRDPRPNRDPDPQPEPDPEPTRSPRPDPEPTEDLSKYFLSDDPDGYGLSKHTARAGENWDITTIAGHGNQDAKTQRSRKAMARLSVGFTEAVFASQDPVRDFQCVAVLTSGSQRLITDPDYGFAISLWKTDSGGYQPEEEVKGTRVHTKSFDLGPNRERTMVSNVYEDLDSAEGTNYMCRVEYRPR